LPTISWQYLVVLGQFGGLFMHFIYVDLSLFGWLDLHLECFEHFMQLIGVVSSLNLIIYFLFRMMWLQQAAFMRLLTDHPCSLLSIFQPVLGFTF
jgi:hypothetical protein